MFVVVKKYAATKKRITRVGPLGDELDIPEGVDVFFVNTRVADTTFGFIMTADGVVAAKTTNCDMTPDEIREHVPHAKDMIARGHFDSMGIVM